MRFDTQTVASVKCDGPACDSASEQKISSEHDHSRRFPAKPDVPHGWYVVQQDGSRVFCSLSCLREWLGHWTVYRGGDPDPKATATELREFWLSLRHDERGTPFSSVCAAHGRGCEYRHDS